MCGRFVCFSPLETLQAQFQIDVVKAAPETSYNIAPTQFVSAVVQNERGTRGLVRLKWGLIPPWAKDASGAARMINARAETAAEKPSFRDALRHRRCLVVANGFYEWPAEKSPAQKRQPVFITARDSEVLAFAGLYSFWKDPNSEEQLATCTVLTTAANAAIAGIHHRMPVILKAEDYASWLDKSKQSATELAPLLTGLSAEETQWYPVSPAINKVTYNQPEALAPHQASL